MAGTDSVFPGKPVHVYGIWGPLQVLRRSLEHAHLKGMSKAITLASICHHLLYVGLGVCRMSLSCLVDCVLCSVKVYVCVRYCDVCGSTPITSISIFPVCLLMHFG